MIYENIELLTLKITTNSVNFTLNTIYRPHSKHIQVDEFTNLLNSLLQKDVIKKNKLIIIGDLNINLLEHTTHTPTNNFLASLQTLNLYPHISKPTRFPDSSNFGEPSFLEHIFTNFNSNFHSGILHFPISDHLPIFLNIDIPPKTYKAKIIEVRDYSVTNKQNFANAFKAIDWNTVLCSLDINSNFNCFLNKINELLNIFPS